MTEVCSVDFETWARVNIKLGSYRYLVDPATRFLMMAWAFNDGMEPELWWPGQPLPERIVDHVRSGGIMSGWNAMSFERIAWRHMGATRHGFPEVRDEQWFDPMLLAVAHNMPRSLEQAASFVGTPVAKDKEGRRLMLKLTSAKTTPDPDKINPAELVRLGEYCRTDVRVEQAVATRMLHWPQVYPWPQMVAIDRAINDRGIAIDVNLVQGLYQAAVDETAKIDADMNRLTNGRVRKVSDIQRLKDWLLELGVPLPLKPEKRTSEDDEDLADEDDGGVVLPGAKLSYQLGKRDIMDLLARRDIPDIARQAMEWRLEAAKASTKKLKTMLEAVGPDGRVRWMLKLFGAQQSGRWSGAVVQPHNFVRDTVGNDDDAEKAFQRRHGRKPEKADADEVHHIGEELVDGAVADAMTGSNEMIRLLQGPVLPFISRMMRRCLTARAGYTLIQGDYSAVEARLTDWFCQNIGTLKAYEEGRDVYRLLASMMMGVPPEQLTREQRQRGKVSKLALGFTGGKGALLAMGRQYGMEITEDEAKLTVKQFRDANPELVKFGQDIYCTACLAVTIPQREFPIPPLNVATFHFDGQALRMKLPSGRNITYWGPKIEGEDDFGSPILTCWQIKGGIAVRRKLWSGILIENLASGSAVDMLAGALVRIEGAGIPVVLHVHDGIEGEVPVHDAERLLPVFRDCMLEAPPWTRIGHPLPIGADIHIGNRFG
jgi:DNA polymerase